MKTVLANLGRAIRVRRAPAREGAAPAARPRGWTRRLSWVVVGLVTVSAGVLGIASPAAAAYPSYCPGMYFENVWGVPAFTTGGFSFYDGIYCQIGKTKLIMQNGDLYVYDERGVIRWRASWYNSNVIGDAWKATMQPDGNFVLYDWDGFAEWASDTATGFEGRLAVQYDGNVVVYTPGWNAGWATHTNH